MKLTKKILTIISLSTLGLACLLLILAIFKVPVFKGILLRVLLISATLAVGCAFAISELNVIKRKKIVGWIGLSLLALSMLCAIIIFVTPLLVNENVFNRITGILSIFSVLFIIIISFKTKLENKMLALQIITYVVLSILVLILCLLIAGVDIFAVKGMLQVFGIVCVISVGLLIAVAVISAKTTDAEIKPEIGKFVKVSQEEYSYLKAENQALKQKVAELEEKISKQ